MTNVTIPADLLLTLIENFNASRHARLMDAEALRAADGSLPSSARREFLSRLEKVDQMATVLGRAVACSDGAIVSERAYDIGDREVLNYELAHIVVVSPAELLPGTKCARGQGPAESKVLAYTVLTTPRVCRDGYVALVQWADGGREDRFWPSKARIPVIAHTSKIS